VKILFEDEALLVIDKPAGLLVHRTALDAHTQDTVLERLRQGRHRGEGLYAVHRLDRATSGVLVIARDSAAASAIGASFEAGRVRKSYLALVRGWPAPASGRIDKPLARDPERPSTGQMQLHASTRYRVLQRYSWPFQTDPRFRSSRYALVLARALTGRRHQIRRHFKQIAHPLMGDTTHGKGVHNRAVGQWLGCNRLWLHAVSIVLPHPRTGQSLRIRAEPDAHWQALRVNRAGSGSPESRSRS
jgi:tRNA pseudouridine65 synthase